MKRLPVRRMILLICITVLVPFSGCTQERDEIDGAAVLNALLEQVAFGDTLTDVGDSATLYFSGLPEGTEIQLYMGSGYFADEAVLLELPEGVNAKTAEEAVQNHLGQLRSQFMNYIPEEVQKIDNAVLYQDGSCYFICITEDLETARNIFANAHDLSLIEGDEKNQTVSAETEEDTEKETEESAAAAPETEAVETSKEQSYPLLQSKSGTYYDYGTNAIRVDNSAFERYTYVDASASNYAETVNKAADALAGQINVYDLLIPTAIGVVLPDDIAEIFPEYTDQGKAIEQVFDKLSSYVIPVRCFDNLMRHRDEYLYFRTDFHWNGKAAYYAYQSFCEVKGMTAIPLEEREEKQFEGFLGALYWNSCGEDPILGETPDTVEAYLPKSSNAAMQITNENGEMISWDIINDVSQWKASAKYSAFAGADSPFSVFQNPDVTDGSVCVIVKESYGNALLPYLVDHYSTIYEIDYRYWSGNLVEFVKEHKADDLIFANNLSMIHSDYLIGKLRQIIE